MHGGAVRTLQSVTTAESELWARAVDGDGDAFARIHDLHGARVQRHALRLTGHLHDSQDVTASAFFELWRKRTSVRVVNGSVAPWLLVTATNIALNHSRALRRYASMLERLPRLREGSAELEEKALSEALLDVDPALLAQIRALPRKDQELLSLVALEGYTLADAAVALSLSEQAARSRWQRTRHQLQDRRRPSAHTAAPTPSVAGGPS